MTNYRFTPKYLLSVAACVVALAAAPALAQTRDPNVGADQATRPAAEDASTVGSAMLFPFAPVSVVPVQRQTEAVWDESPEGPDLTLTTIVGLAGIAALGFAQRRARYGDPSVGSAECN